MLHNIRVIIFIAGCLFGNIGSSSLCAMDHAPSKLTLKEDMYHDHHIEIKPVPLWYNTGVVSQQVITQSIDIDPYFVNNSVEHRASIRQASTPRFCNVPDPLMVTLRDLQSQGNKKAIELIKEGLKKELSKAWFSNKKIIESQLQKVEGICNARITELLSIVRNGTKQQALEAIKEIRRLSPYSYILHENMPQQLSESHQKRLDQHIKQSGFNYFIAAEIIFQKRYSGIQTSVQPNDKQGTYFFEGQPIKQPVSGKQEIKDPSLIVPIIPQEVGYDLALTTPTQLNLFYQYVTVDPKADFPGYMQQVKSAIADLKHKGLYTAETVVLFTKEFIEGTLAHSGHVVQHPIQYGKDFVEGNVEILKKVGNLFIDIATLSDDELKQSMHERVEVITQWYNQMSQTVPHMSRTDWANITSRLFTDYLVFKGVAKGISVVKNIPEVVKQNEFLGTVQANLEQAILKHPEMVTPEGMMFKSSEVLRETGTPVKEVVVFEKIKLVIKDLHPNLSKNIHHIEKLHETVAKANKLSCPGKAGRLADGVSVIKFHKIENEVNKYYEQIRNCSTDIVAISQNTGVDKSIIQQIKNHVFIEEHKLYNGIRRFNPQEDMAAAWKRLIQNNFLQSDLLLLQHEYIEALIMNGAEVAYSDAHAIANSLYNWDLSL